MAEDEEQKRSTVELKEEEGVVGPGEEPRVSDIRPKCVLCFLQICTIGRVGTCCLTAFFTRRNWESLFPMQTKPAEARKPGTSKLVVAGGLHAVDLDLQRMQVRRREGV